MTKILLSISFIAFISIAMPAFAQNVGGVFPPMVKEGHKSLQYRIAINPDNAQDEFGYAHRLHYQHSINSNFMWRVVGQSKKTNASDFDFDFLGAELFWEFSDDTDKHKTGIRFDARLRDDNRSEVFGLHWMNQFNLSEGWQVRALVISFAQTGDNCS